MENFKTKYIENTGISLQKGHRRSKNLWWNDEKIWLRAKKPRKNG